MPSFKYAGDGPVNLPTLGLVDVEPGQVVEVDDEAAKGMTGSPVWERVTKTKNKES